jgi:hypothetical protein
MSGELRARKNGASINLMIYEIILEYVNISLLTDDDNFNTYEY